MSASKNPCSFIGHRFAKEGVDGDITFVELISYTISEEKTGSYSLQTGYNENFIVENMLSITAEEHRVGRFEYFIIGDGMKYDEEAKNADIERYGLYTWEEFADYLTKEQFEMFNGAYFKILVGRGILTYEDIIEMILKEVYTND